MQTLLIALVGLTLLSSVNAATKRTPPSSKASAKPATGGRAAPGAKQSQAAKPPSSQKKSTSTQSRANQLTKPLTEKEALASLTDAERLRLQVFLDRSNFAPGKIDGMWGEFTLKAAERWMSAKQGRTWASLLSLARGMKSPTTVSFILPESAQAYVGSLPASLAEKAAAKRLPYRSLAEYAAERYHTDEATLARLNPGTVLSQVKLGTSLRVPNVIPFRIESPKIDPNAARVAEAKIRIYHDQHLIEVRGVGDALVAAFPITIGSKPTHVRTGTWKVEWMAPNPTFTWDDEMLKHGRKGDKRFILPPGPNNPVGVLWMEIEPVNGPEAHIGIHGTNDPARIGRNHSSGCIRLANWDIVRLARLVGPGAQVKWSGTPVIEPQALVSAN